MHKLILHTCCYYLCWFACIFLASKNYHWLGFFICLLISGLQFYWQRKTEKTENFLFFMLLIALVGLIIDTICLRTGLIYFNANPFGTQLSPPWMVALWLNFSIILYVFFKKYFSRFWLCFFVCLFGFPMAYLSGIKLGAARLMHGNTSLVMITLIWSIALPTVLYVYKKYDVHKKC